MSNNAQRRPGKKRAKQTQALIERVVDQLQEAWQEEILSDAPQWGCALGAHLRLCELEHLQEAAGELLP